MKTTIITLLAVALMAPVKQSYAFSTTIPSMIEKLIEAVAERNYTHLNKKKRTATSTQSGKIYKKVVSLKVDKVKGDASVLFEVKSVDPSGNIQEIHTGHIPYGAEGSEEVVLEDVYGNSIFIEYQYLEGYDEDIILSSTIE